MEDTDVEQSCSLMKSYTLSSKIARMLLQANEQSHLDFPHDVSPEEKFLIEYSEGSLFVLGRSGTGKTTVMLHKMHRLDVGSQCNPDKDEGTFKQMMVTASPVLASAIKRNFDGMKISALESQRSSMSSESQSDPLNITMNTHEEAGDASDETLRFDQLSSGMFPLISTYNSFLRMVDKALSPPFFTVDTAGSKVSTALRSVVDLFRFETLYYPRLGDITGGGKFKVYMYI